MTKISRMSPWLVKMVKTLKSKSNLLVTIMDFLYHGEANVLQDDLDSFLALAEEFKLRGLTGDSQSEEEQQNETQKSSKYSLKREFGQRPVQQNEQPIPNPNQEIQYSDGKNDKTVALANTRTSVQLHDLDEQIKSMITKSDISAGHNRGFLSTCNVCGKEAPFNDMRRHVETNHITGVSHSCNMCGKISRTRQALRMHKLRNHNNDRTPNSMFCS